MTWFKKKEEMDSGSDEWCVILAKAQAGRKPDVVQALANMFSLTPDFAEQLLSNTPVMLVDNLSGELASKVKQHLEQAGAEISVTNERKDKRKCCRLGWKTPPDLSFLGKPEPTLPARETSSVYEIEMRHLEEKLAIATAQAVEYREKIERLSDENAQLAKALDEAREEERRVAAETGQLQALTQAKAEMEQSLREFEAALEETRKAKDAAEAEKWRLAGTLDQMEGRLRQAESERELAWNFFKEKADFLEKEIQALRQEAERIRSGN